MVHGEPVGFLFGSSPGAGGCVEQAPDGSAALGGFNDDRGQMGKRQLKNELELSVVEEDFGDGWIAMQRALSMTQLDNTARSNGHELAGCSCRDEAAPSRRNRPLAAP